MEVEGSNGRARRTPPTTTRRTLRKASTKAQRWCNLLVARETCPCAAPHAALSPANHHQPRQSQKQSTASQHRQHVNRTSCTAWLPLSTAPYSASSVRLRSRVTSARSQHDLSRPESTPPPSHSKCACSKSSAQRRDGRRQHRTCRLATPSAVFRRRPVQSTRQRHLHILGQQRGDTI